MAPDASKPPRGFVRPLGGTGVLAPVTSAGAISSPVARAASIIDVSPTTGLFTAGVTGTLFTAILPTGLATTSAVINPNHVSTTIDVSLIALPVVPRAGLPPVAPDLHQPESADRASLIASREEQEPAALDELFGSIASASGDLPPWQPHTYDAGDDHPVIGPPS